MNISRINHILDNARKELIKELQKTGLDITTATLSAHVYLPEILNEFLYGSGNPELQIPLNLEKRIKDELQYLTTLSQNLNTLTLNP